MPLSKLFLYAISVLNKEDLWKLFIFLKISNQISFFHLMFWRSSILSLFTVFFFLYFCIDLKMFLFYVFLLFNCLILPSCFILIYYYYLSMPSTFKRHFLRREGAEGFSPFLVFPQI